MPKRKRQHQQQQKRRQNFLPGLTMVHDEDIGKQRRLETMSVSTFSSSSMSKTPARMSIEEYRVVTSAEAEEQRKERDFSRNQRRRRNKAARNSRKEKTHLGRSTQNDHQGWVDRVEVDALTTMDAPMTTALHWPSTVNFIPLEEEESMVRTVMSRHAERERGMMKDKPDFVINKFYAMMKSHAPSMTFIQLCSLRRHHIKLLNPHKSMQQLGLGDITHINHSAELFEKAVQAYLEASNISFLTEQQLVRRLNQEQKPLKATPDFTFLEHPILLKKVVDGISVEETTIHWLEVKMFYGASTIPHGSKGAVGSVLAAAKKYVDHFGTGAMVFMMGCGENLAADLKQVGVIALDCCGQGHVDLNDVYAHQMTWCANKKGYIMP